MDYLKELDEKGYVVVPNVLDTKEVEYCKHEFKSWQSTIPNHDMFHKYLIPMGSTNIIVLVTPSMRGSFGLDPRFKTYSRHYGKPMN